MIIKNMMKHTILAFLTFILIGCGTNYTDVSVKNQKFGILQNGVVGESVYKISKSNRDVAFALEATVPNSAVGKSFVTTWQYREGGIYKNIIQTERKIDSTDDTYTFPLTSEKDFYLGEYMIEVYLDDKMITAQRFWVVSDDKVAREDVDLFKLATCITLVKDSKCDKNPLCTYVPSGIEGDQFDKVCEPK